MHRIISSRKLALYLIGSLLVGLFLGLGLERAVASQPAPVVLPAEPVSPDTTTDMLSGSNVADQLSNIFARVAQQVNPSVVTIFTETTIKVQQQLPLSPFEEFFGPDLFQHFFQMPPQPQGNLKQMGLGSGVIVTSDGIILTNNHVVDGADNIKVRLLDGREFKATVKGTDPQTDLAVIKIDAQNLRPIRLGDSDKARVGEWVLAIGSPLNPQLEHTVTAGIISAKGRSGVGLTQYEDYIQTDAAINPGNSGGALVNTRGELIGINSAIATKTGGFMGIGFAIPVNLAQKVMNDILTKGKVVRGWLGVVIQNLTPEMAKALKLETTHGVIISQVQKGSPADKAGLKEGDVVLRLNGREVTNTVEMSTRIASTSPGKVVVLTILRDGKVRDLKVKLGELNPMAQQMARGESTYTKIGLKVANITPELSRKYRLPSGIEGVVVTGVDPSGIAAAVGIQEGDVILKVDRKAVKSVADFDALIRKVKPGEDVLLYLRRGEANLFVAFTMPEE